MHFQNEKNLVRSFYSALENADCTSVAEVLARYTDANWLWRSYYPFYQQKGAHAVAQNFWQPFLAAFSALQRRQDIFFAGLNEIDGFTSRWVVSMGHLVGLFDSPFLNIPATGKMAFFRYCEFNKVADGKITETAFYFDLPHLMVQAGLHPFPTQRGAQIVQPGPLTHRGLCYDPKPADAGEKTLALMQKMIADIGQWDSKMSLEAELARTWHKDMIWWGPTGIGATYTIARYAKQHAGPFRAAFTDRSRGQHLCRLAEGDYGGFFGWPNFTARLQKPFLGIEPSGKASEFRVIDIYRRKGDKLAENWVFIDLPHWMKQHGVDILPIDTDSGA